MTHERQVLVLTSWYYPHRVIRWQTAITGIYKGSFDVVEEYQESVSSPSVTWQLPAVIRLKRTIPKKKRSVRFSRANIYLRDNYECQYCGIKPGVSQLTMDHVVPKSLGGKTTWSNIVTSCKKCNWSKGSKTCREAGRFPLQSPRKPETLPVAQVIGINISAMPKEWLPYLEPYSNI